MKRGFLILALLCGLVHASIACTVLEPIPMCSIYWDTPLAFLGRVVTSELIHEGPWLNGVSLINSNRALFAVTETYRGEVKKEIRVRSSISPCDGGEFRVGELYLVFANQDKSGEWQAIGGYGATHQVRVEAEDDGLRWFRSWVKAPAGAVIFGYRFVTRMPPAESAVTLAGPVPRTARFDSGGKFAVTGLPPGRYAVSAIPPEGRAAIPPSQTVDVIERGCAQVSFSIR